MKNKNLLLSLVGLTLLASLGAAWFFAGRDGVSSPSAAGSEAQATDQPATSQAPTSATTTPETSLRLPGEESLPPLTLVTYDGAAFSPQTVIIKQGEVVSFKNEGARSVWPASAVHPTHTAYPEKGGCIGSIFDACGGYGKGNVWSFKFDAKGSWSYHDHLNPSARGTVVVE